MTFASAAVRTGAPNVKDLLGYWRQVFATADAVPPLAKISFGTLLAIIVYALHRAGTTRLVEVVTLLVGVPLAFYLSTCVLPVNYYPLFDSAEYFPAHLLVAAVGCLAPYAILRKADPATRTAHKT